MWLRQHRTVSGAHERHTSGALDSVARVTGLLGFTGQFPYNFTPSRLGDIAELPNKQKQTEEVRQKGETEEYVPNQRTRQKFRKGTTCNGDKQSTTKEVKVVAIKC